MEFYSSIQDVIRDFLNQKITEERKNVLAPLIDYIVKKGREKETVKLNFICTHNSRRSQFGQVWASVAGAYFNISCEAYSGGVEVTAFHPNAIQSLEEIGFIISKMGEKNPVYAVKFAVHTPSLKAFSKLFDDSYNPASNFGAIITCNSADENCPFVSGCDVRIPVKYDDPKEYDNTPLQASKYKERALEIGAEIFYAFGKAKSILDGE